MYTQQNWNEHPENYNEHLSELERACEDKFVLHTLLVVGAADTGPSAKIGLYQLEHGPVVACVRTNNTSNTCHGMRAAMMRLNSSREGRQRKPSTTLKRYAS